MIEIVYCKKIVLFFLLNIITLHALTIYELLVYKPLIYIHFTIVYIYHNTKNTGNKNISYCGVSYSQLLFIFACVSYRFCFSNKNYMLYMRA